MSIKSKVEGMRAIWHFDNRWELLLSRTLFRNDNLKIYRIQGLEILVDHDAGDPNGARHVLVSNMYRQFLSRMEFEAESLNVLDLGANGGGFPLMLHVNQLRLKKLACVEFNPNTFSRLRFNIERNLSCEFTCLNVALCGERLEIEVRLGSGSTGDSIYRQTEQRNGDARVYRIEGLTFDDIYDRTFGDEVVDICKMDVEGAEYEVFTSAHHERIERCRYLLIEIHDDEDRRPEEVISELKRQGFAEINRDADVYLFGNTRFRHQA